jgi:hypothetical protein
LCIGILSHQHFGSGNIIVHGKLYYNAVLISGLQTCSQPSSMTSAGLRPKLSCTLYRRTFALVSLPSVSPMFRIRRIAAVSILLHLRFSPSAAFPFFDGLPIPMFDMQVSS